MAKIDCSHVVSLGGMYFHPEVDTFSRDSERNRALGIIAHEGAVPARGANRFREILLQARQEGTVPMGKPSKVASKSTVAYLARQERKRRKAQGKASAKVSKAKVVENPSKIEHVPGPGLFSLCSMFEAGKVGVEALLPYTGPGNTIADILGWYINEQMANNLAEVRVANGGGKTF